ncbi:MAG: PIN domain-containing protein [Alphaproteobacteria bacterium]|nr:PIN domain-containing protein [Alphaproteobacteria bacterium]
MPFSLDANILVYGADGTDRLKHRIAVDIIDRCRYADCVLTLQCLGEFYAATTRKQHLARDIAAARVGDLMDMIPLIAPSPAGVRTAVRTAAAGLFSYWDALLLATAAEAGCTAVLSDDMTDGATLAGVTVVNPFTLEGGIAPAAATLIGIPG